MSAHAPEPGAWDPGAREPGTPALALQAAARDPLAPAEVGEERPGEPVLVVRDLHVSLGGREILAGVDFEIHAGEFTGLIGTNGAGKTTLQRVILGLQPVDSGQILLGGDGQWAARGRRGGEDARGRSGGRALSVRGAGGRLGYVPQKFLLDPDMPLRARDLVALGLEARRLGPVLPSRARRQRVQAALEAVGAVAFADARVGRLSGGEQQRVLIAHALISEPRLLLLDEPLANLDPHSTREVVGVLARLARERGLAVLISAHEINPLLPVMDRLVYLAGGRSASGTAAEVVRPEVLSRLYGDHVDVLRVHGRVLVVTGTAGPSAEALGEAEHAREIQVVT